MTEVKVHSFYSAVKRQCFRAGRIWKRAAAAILVIVAALWILFCLDSGSTYLWIKAVHVVAVISWMAGMLYLPRLFVYHCAAKKDSVQSETFKIMERSLLRYIINPGMVATWVTGLWMAWEIYHFHGGWLHLKLGAVLLLSAFHGFLARAARHFAGDHKRFSEKTWRILNEVPTLLMIVAVVAVIIKIPT